MTEPLRVGLAGLGTVGSGVLRLLTENAQLIAARAGRPVETATAIAIAARRSTICAGSTIRWIWSAPRTSTSWSN